MRCANCPLKDRPVYYKDRGEDIELPLIAFVGSSPKSFEVKSKIAFSGDGPKVLRRVLSSLDIPIDECYFTHAISCQTPKGRRAKSSEIDACSNDLKSRLLRRNPKLIIAMGTDAIHALIDTNRAASTIRGQIHSWQGIPVLPTIDPHGVVKVHPRFAPEDEKWDASGSPDAFPDLQCDLQRAAKFVLHGVPLVEQIPYHSYVHVRDAKSFRRVISRLKSLPPGTVISADVETDGLDYRTGKILTLGLCWRAGTGVGIDWSILDKEDKRSISDCLSRHRLVFHNGYFDVPWLHADGVSVDWTGDTMLLHYLLDERSGSHGLERLAIDRYSWPAYESKLKQTFRVGSAAATDAESSYSNVEIGSLLDYNIADCDVTYRLWTDLVAEAEEENITQIHDQILMPAARHFLKLEQDGMLVDQEYLDQVGHSWRVEMDDLAQQMRSYPGAEGINLNSSRQIAHYLFDVLGLQSMPGESGEYVDPDLVLALTENVQDEEAQEYFRVASSVSFMKLKPRSTSTYMLWWLADQHPWSKALVRYRVIGTRYRTYFEGIKSRLIQGRIRPRYRLHGTRTGRLSSTDPNIHGIARDKQIKDIFISDPGYVLIAADYSQAEVRMMAHYAKDEVLMRSLQESDIHRAISRQLFSVSEEQLDQMDPARVKFLRRAAKTIIFGLIYGRSAESLAPQLGVSLEETDKYIANLFQMMPNVPKFISRQQENVIKSHEAVSIFGRKRRFPLILKGNASAVKRQGVNMPIQSSVSDMTLLANLRIVKELESRGISVKLWPHIHDGFLFQVREEDVDDAVATTKHIMSDPPFKTPVHFAAEVEIGRRWGSLKEVIEE